MKMAAPTEPGSLENAAFERKKRLMGLRKREHSDNDLTVKRAAGESAEKLPTPVFRSYRPNDEDLKQKQSNVEKITELSEQVAEQLAASKPEPLLEEVDLTNLAPRKPDWDLKRDVAKKLQKLEKRTQRALAEITRERLSAGNVDLATAVNAATMNADEEG